MNFIFAMPETDQGGFHSVIEILDRLLSKPLPEKWGKWKLDRDRRVIYYDGRHEFWFPLGQMNNSAEVLDWIVELHEKSWATPKTSGTWWRRWMISSTCRTIFAVAVSSIASTRRSMSPNCFPLPIRFPKQTDGAAARVSAGQTGIGRSNLRATTLVVSCNCWRVPLAKTTPFSAEEDRANSQEQACRGF